MKNSSDYLILESITGTVVEDIYNCIDGLAPFSTAEHFDNVGLIIGSRKNKADKLLICLDITEKILNIAVKNKVDCIVCHHPLLFNAINKINDSYFDYSLITKLIKKDISVIAAHTNYDKCNTNNSIKSLELIGKGNIEKSVTNEYGAILSLDNRTTFEDILDTVKVNFGKIGIRGYKNNAKDVIKIGYYAGSLGHNTEIILQSGVECDILISSEIKYSHLLVAEKIGLNVIDIEHNQSEKVFVSNVFNYILGTRGNFYQKNS